MIDIPMIDIYFNRFLNLEKEAIPWIDIFHAIYNARDFQQTVAPQSYAQLLVAYLLSCLGGTMITAIILGQPIGWLCSDATFGTYIAVFILAFSPLTKDLFKAITNAPIIRTVISAMDDLSWGNSISSLGVQRVLHPVHADSQIKSTVSAAIICGITSGCGGGLIRSMLNFNNSNWSFATPRHLSQPHWPIQLSAALSILYYFINNPHGYLPYTGVSINEARWTLIVLCVLFNTVWNTIGLSDLLNYHKAVELKPIKTLSTTTTTTTASSSSSTNSRNATPRKVATPSPSDDEPTTPVVETAKPRRTKSTASGSKKKA